MLTVYTAKKYFRKKIIRYINGTFDKYIDSVLSDFDAADALFLKEIDGAEPLRIRDDILVTKENSVYTLREISSGAKTCLLAHHFPKADGYILDMIHCGQNAVVSLFKNLDSTNIPLYLSSQVLDCDIPDLENTKFNINNKAVGNYYALWRAMSCEE